MARPRTEPGTYGKIRISRIASGAYYAQARICDWDGQPRRIGASGRNEEEAVLVLTARIKRQLQISDPGAEITAESPFPVLARNWLADLKIDSQLSEGTKEVYESGLRTLLMPAFEHTTVGELTAGRIERFLKAQRAKSYPAAKRSKALLNHLIRYAMLHGAIAHNPVQATSSLRRPPTYNKALTIEEINAIRKATRVRSHDPGTPGPKADQQLADIIEVMLGTSARIGEALALRNRDLDLTAMPPTVHICGTVVVRKGNGTYRQPFPKTVTSNRIVAIPEFAAEALRARMVTRGNSDPEQLVFSTKSGAPLNPSNVRRTFRQVIQLAGLSDRAVKLHSLRKTVATLISQHAGEETAAHMLGHSGTQTLRQHYIERTRRPQPATAEILGRLAPHTLGLPRDDVADSA